MPIVKTKLGRLMALTGLESVEKLREILFNLKCETEVDGDTIAIEVQSDRIDMFSVEGIAYAVRLYAGLDGPKVLSSNVVFEAIVDPPKKRPYIAIAAVKGVNLDEEMVNELIEFQERLHITYGRGRRKVAIGLHDLSKLPHGKIVYKDVDINETSMIPLFDGKRMTVREVLELTKHGKMYGGISLYENKHPALIAGDEVIALPPVINSDITKLEASTKDVFIDVTGTDLNAVLNVLNAIVHALAFYGGEVLGAKLYYPNTVIVTPNLEAKKVVVDVGFASSWLGLQQHVVVAEGPKALHRMGYVIVEVDANKIVVEVPPYRCDVLHQVDVVEDMAIGIGYENLGLEFIKPPEIRKMSKKPVSNVIAGVVREVLSGLGYVEVNTLTLVSSSILELVSDEPYPLIVNALSKELNALRNSLIPSLLLVLRDSQYVVQPIKLFDVGEVAEKCVDCYNGWRNELRVAFGIMDSEIRFEEIHSDLYAVLSELELIKNVKVEECKRKAFISGRCGCIKYHNRVVGVIGEIHPEVLKALGIEYPVAIVELYIDELSEP